MSEIDYKQPVDPLAALKETGVTNVAQFLANTRDPEKPWIIYGAGSAVDADTFDDATLAVWRSEGRITTETPVTNPQPVPPTLSDVAATPDGADPTQATVAWTTDTPADSQVHYGLDASYGTDSTLDTVLKTSHTALLTGLTAETDYHYSVASSGASSPDATFTTAAPPA